eukprot:2073385-Rhodomonas_salina.1
MCGADIVYGATGCAWSTVQPRYQPKRMLRDVRYCHSISRYQPTRMSSTDIACGGISLRVCYAMSSTDIAYDDTRPPGASSHR